MRLLQRLVMLGASRPQERILFRSRLLYPGYAYRLFNV
jgi:hypothetical protein